MTGNVNSAYARAELLLQNTALDIARQGEGQLVIHMLKHAHQDELALIRSAASNAKFVNEFCWPINWSDQTQGSDYVDGIPLLLRSVKTATVDELFNKLALIDRRDSFSFLRTSYVGGIPAAGTVVGPFVRINTGHESKGAMVEFFYALGHLAATSADLFPAVGPAGGVSAGQPGHACPHREVRAEHRRLLLRARGPERPARLCGGPAAHQVLRPGSGPGHDLRPGATSPAGCSNC